MLFVFGRSVRCARCCGLRDYCGVFSSVSVMGLGEFASV